MNRSTLPQIISIFLIFLVIFSIENVFAQPDQGNRPFWYKSGPYNEDAGPIANFLANKLLPIIGWFNIGGGYAPKYFFAEPSVIEIDYLENITVDIVFGSTRREASGYQKRVFDEVTLVYNVEFPPNIQESAWSVSFDPPVMDLRAYTEDYEDRGITDIPSPRTKLHLKLDIPPTPDNPIQDLVLRVNVSIIRKYTNLAISHAFGGIISGRIASLPFREVFNEVSIGTKGCDLFVKIKPFRDVELILPDPIEMNPNDIKGARIAVRNRGSHIEQFGFRVYGEEGNLIVNTPSPITLAPGEIGYTDIGLINRPILYDHGTLHSITVEVYPYDETNITLFSGDLTVRTKGFALQSIFSFRFSWHIFFAVAIIIFLLFVIGIIRRLKIRKLKQKPKKPWTLPDKKQHLTRLLKENKKQQYTIELNQLKKEHKAAMINHKKEIKSELKQQRRKSILYRPFYKIISLIKLPKKQIKKPEKTKITLPKRTKVKTVKQKKVTVKKSPKKPEMPIDLQRQQLLDRIKKQQQKLAK